VRQLCDHEQQTDNERSASRPGNRICRSDKTLSQCDKEKMNLFGAELRRLRRRSGLSQETLAARAGLSPEAISLLERGRRSPRMTTMRLLAEGLSLPESDRSALFASVNFREPSPPSLPVFADHPVGRDAELRAVAELIERDDTRLLTLLGPAGVGKTRIAVGYASTQPVQFPDGVHWFPIGTLSDPTTVLSALAGALGVRGSPKTSVEEIIDHLRPLSSLLVIDNAEHHLATCAELCRAILAGAARLTILITSRHLTGVPGEVALPVVPLQLPPHGTPADQLHSIPSCQLFLARSLINNRLDQAAADAVIRICQRLDGLPLALELAAARTNVLTVHELADTLESELSILQTPGGEQELVDAMVGWTYQRLSPTEQLIFERLSVFGGSFTRGAVAEVCGAGLDEIEVVDVLSALVSKSLVVRQDEGSTQARFRLLQLIRQYGRSKFALHPDRAATHRRYAEYYRDLVEQAAPRLTGHDQHEWLSIIDREVGNIRPAIAWSIQHKPEIAMRTVAALGRWCYLRGRYTDGRRWAASALRAWPGAPSELRAPVLVLAGTLAFLQCDYAEARPLVEEAQSLFAETGDRVGLGWSIGRLGAIACEQGRYEKSAELHREALRLAEEAGDDHDGAVQLNYLCFLAWLSGDLDTAEKLGPDVLRRMRELGDQEGVIWALINLGTTARYRGDLTGARLLLSQCLDLCEELSFREGIAWSLNQLGVVARLRGETEGAFGMQLASLNEHHKLGDRWREASVRDELAALAMQRGHPAEAARQLASADRLRAEIHAAVPAAERADRQGTAEAAQRALGATYELAAITAGLNMTREIPAKLHSSDV
jgi:predicted ATPase/DNA-binding XRE family transcriptional regulator